MIEVDGNPPKIFETQFSTIKRRNGRDSVPFLGLQPGEHLVRFNGKRKKTDCIVKVWLCPYGWAWEIIKKLKCCNDRR